jgi:predicted Fe-Mo cluster-binding NifX family protein
MKILLTSQGETLDAPLDIRFGRAKNFLVYDTETKTCSVVPNTQNLNAAQGAGIQAATTAASTGAELVITGHCGPKAFRVLEAAEIKVYTAGSGSAAEALNAYENGELQALASADVDGHWV